ncbi:MAG: EamA family transporter [Candidatus Woesearchaeota archaeon]
MLELWLILIIIPPFIWALANFYDKVLVTNFFSSVYSFIFLTSILSLPTAILILLILGFYEFLGLFKISILLIIGFFFLAGFILYAKALEIEESSKVGSLFVFVTIFIMIFEFILLGTSLSISQYVASFIIIISSLIMINSTQITSIISIFKVNRAFVYMIINSLIIATYFTLLRYFFDLHSFFSVMFWIFLGSFIFLISMLFYKPSRIEIITSSKKIISRKIFIFLIVIVNILTLLPDLVYNYVISIAPSVALVSVVTNVQYIFLFIFGILFTKFLPSYFEENIEFKQLIIKALCVIGIAGGVVLIQL